MLALRPIAQRCAELFMEFLKIEDVRDCAKLSTCCRVAPEFVTARGPRGSPTGTSLRGKSSAGGPSASRAALAVAAGSGPSKLMLGARLRGSAVGGTLGSGPGACSATGRPDSLLTSLAASSGAGPQA